MPTYYLSAATGNDANDGLSPAAAWQTTGRANANAWRGGDVLLLARGGVFGGSLLFTGLSGIEVGAYGPGHLKPTLLCGDSYGLRFVGCGGVNVHDLHVVGSGAAGGSSTSQHAAVEVINPNTSGQLAAPTLWNLDLEHCYAGYDVRGHAAGITGDGSGFSGVTRIGEIWVRDVLYHGGRVCVIPLLDAGGNPIPWDQYNLATTLPAYPQNNWSIWKGRSFDEVDLGAHDVVRAYGDLARQNSPIHTGDCVHVRNARKVRGAVLRGRDGGAYGYGPAGVWDQECDDVEFRYCHVDNQQSLNAVDGDAFDTDGGSTGSYKRGCLATRSKGAGFLFGPYEASTVPTGGWDCCFAVDCAQAQLAPFYVYGTGTSPSSVNSYAFGTQATPSPGGTVTVDFARAGLWAPAPWRVNAPGGTATVSGALATLDGAQIATADLYGPGTALTGGCTFHPAAPWQHFGFAVDAHYDGPPWAMFSTYTGGGLWCRSPGGDTQVAGSYLGARHVYTVDWQAGQVVFQIDGAVVATHAVALAGPARVVFSDAGADGRPLVVG